MAQGKIFKNKELIAQTISSMAAMETAIALMEMYQAGFLDGFNEKAYKKKMFKSLKNKCRKCFEKRFKSYISFKK